MDIKIDKGIPIPDHPKFRGKNSKSFLYRKTLMEMEVGDSFLIKTANSVDKLKARYLLNRAAMQAGAMFIGHTGGLIKDSGIQRFATGGMVQGQDNVPILAQAGEFVMQRSAVQNIGVENLAAMNSGQSNGGITVNIQGNMIGNDEFVRDNILPQIKKAAQQNLA